MAFRLMDFGVPNFDTNVNYLYKTAVEHGDSHLCGDEEYVCYRMGDSPILVVLRFAFEADGETPTQVIAHTFLDNAVAWSDGVCETEPGKAVVQQGKARLQAEVVNPSAVGDSYCPMLYADTVKFALSRYDLEDGALLPEGALAPVEGSEVQLLAQVVRVQPVVLSKLWLFSIVELALAEGTISVPVSRDLLEKMLDVCDEGSFCYLRGSLSLLKSWV